MEESVDGGGSGADGGIEENKGENRVEKSGEGESGTYRPVGGSEGEQV